ncbi:MAG: hypothetical protein WAZ34_13860 [Rhodocyclaceae bacterium]
MTGDTSPSFVREAADCGWPVLYTPISMSKLIFSLREQKHRADARHLLPT